MNREPGRAFALSLGSLALTAPFAVHLYLPLIPSVKQSFGLTDWGAQLMFTAAMATMAVATLVAGAVSDKRGRRPVVLAAVSTFVVGSLIAAFATSAMMLLIGRIIQAIGAGAAAALVKAIARDAYGQERLVKAIAYLTMFYAAGPMLAPLAGGFLNEALGWRSAFGFTAGLGSILAVATFVNIQETHTPSKEKTGGSGFIGFFRDARQLFRHARFTCFVLQTALNSGAFLVLLSGASYQMAEALGRPSTDFGLWFLLSPLALFTGNFVASRIGVRVPGEQMVLTGAAITASAVFGQALAFSYGELSPLFLFLPCYLVSLAQGLSMPYAQAGAISTIPKLSGTAAGLALFVHSMIGAIFAQAYGFFADGSVWPMVSLAGVAAFGALCAAAAAAIRERR